MKKNPNFGKNLLLLAVRESDRLSTLEDIEKNAIANFAGQYDQLTTALGMLRLGDHVGWRVLYILHSKRTIRRYEEILDIKVREFFPEEGPSASRSIGYKVAKKLENFWKIVSGDVKIENRREIEP